jgi:hypothetical protein
MKTIAFYSPHLALTGTEVTMYDFADYNEKILGNKSVIIYNDNHRWSHSSTVEKFKKRFDKMYALQGPQHDWHWNSGVTVPLIDEVISKENCDGLYMQKFGNNDNVVSKLCKTYVLCAAPVCEPHGDVYAYVSEWLSQVASGGRYPAVPSMITPLPDITEDLRDELNIPKNAIVFGRTGGDGSFNIPFAMDVIKQVVDTTSNIYFLFQNTPVFYEHTKIKHIGPSSDLEVKSKFINSCDAMIHARNEGESFGCACGEFSMKNKPIVTYFNSKDRNHIHLLGDKGFYYRDPNELYNILLSFKPDPTKDWNGYKDYNPERIMKIFNDVFLSQK